MTDREVLQSIIDAYDCRSELFTSDEECAANLYDRARKQLAAAAPVADLAGLLKTAYDFIAEPGWDGEKRLSVLRQIGLAMTVVREGAAAPVAAPDVSIAAMEEEAQEAARVIVQMQARITELEATMRELLAWAEDAEVQIEGEWGGGRSLAELEAKGMLSDEIVRARNALKTND